MMWWTLLLLVLACAYSHGLNASALADEYNQVLQASDYHFRELKRSVERLHFLEQHVHGAQINKRGTQGNLMASILIFCDSLNHPDRYHLPTGTTTTDTDSTDNQVQVPKNRNNQSSVDTTAISEARHWYQPGANPVRVEVSKSGDVIQMKFDVVSNFTVRVVRETTIRSTSADSVDDRTIVPSPNHDVQVTFSLPESQCDVYDKEEISFHTPNEHQLKWDHATVVLSPCKSLKYDADSLENPSRVQDIVCPQFRVLNHNRDIHLTAGKNTTIDVEVNLNRTYFFLSAIMFDHFEKRLLIAETIFSMAYDKDTVNYHSYAGQYAENLLTTEEINTTDTTNKDVAEASNDGKQFFRKFRATVNTESGHLSGIVIVGGSLDFPGRSLVKMSSCSTSLTLTTPHTTEPLPRGQFIFRNETHFSCKQGYRHFLNGDCFVECFVTGRDITSMTITKKDPPFLKTAAKTKFVTYGTQATGRLIVGPGGAEKDGEYLCVVEDSKGYTGSLTLQLISSGFPEVDKNNSGIEDLRNGSVLIQCSGRGRAPLKTAIYLDGRSEDDRMDTQFHKDIKVHGEGDDSIMISEIVVPKATIQHPKNYIICQVDNDNSRDEEMFYISDFITDYYPNNNHRTSTSSYYQH